jgi:hypothetical protein
MFAYSYSEIDFEDRFELAGKLVNHLRGKYLKAKAEAEKAGDVERVNLILSKLAEVEYDDDNITKSDIRQKIISEYPKRLTEDI